ncbi:MAG: Ig-like domain-containing protein [Candidatus Eremiobacterota bacterium]
MRAFSIILLLLGLALPALAQSGANLVPTSGTTVDNPRGEIGVTFLEPVQPTLSRMFLDGADVTARAILTDSQVRFVPQQPLSTGTHNVRVMARAVSGRTFDLQWSFRITDQAFNPAPADGSTQTTRRPEIGATFFEPVQTPTVRLYVDGQDVTGMCRVSDGQVRLQPGTDLATGAHTARVTATAVSGRAIDGSWKFTLAEGLAVGTPPAGGSTLQRRPEVGATFLVPVQSKTVRLMLDGADVTRRARVSDGQVRYTPRQNLSLGTHTARVTATTSAGQPLDQSWSFVVAGGGANPAPPNGATVTTSRPEIGATFLVPLRTDTVRLYVDGQDVTGSSTVSSDQVRFTPGSDLAGGAHRARVTATATSGEALDQSWSFTVQASGATGQATVVPTGTTSSSRPEVGATFAEPVQSRTVRLFLDGGEVTSRATVTDGQVRFTPPYDLTAGTHQGRVVATAVSGRVIDQSWSFTVGGGTGGTASANPAPANGGSVSSIAPEIGATFYEPVQTGTVRLYLDGEDVTGSSRVSGSQVRYRPGFLPPGRYQARVTAVTSTGKRVDVSWQFTVR